MWVFLYQFDIKVEFQSSPHLPNNKCKDDLLPLNSTGHTVYRTINWQTNFQISSNVSIILNSRQRFPFSTAVTGETERYEITNSGKCSCADRMIGNPLLPSSRHFITHTTQDFAAVAGYFSGWKYLSSNNRVLMDFGKVDGVNLKEIEHRPI